MCDAHVSETWVLKRRNISFRKGLDWVFMNFGQYDWLKIDESKRDYFPD